MHASHAHAAKCFPSCNAQVHRYPQMAARRESSTASEQRAPCCTVTAVTAAVAPLQLEAVAQATALTSSPPPVQIPPIATLMELPIQRPLVAMVAPAWPPSFNAHSQPQQVLIVMDASRFRGMLRLSHPLSISAMHYVEVVWPLSQHVSHHSCPPSLLHSQT